MYRFYKFVPAFLFVLLIPFLTQAQDDAQIYLHNGETIVGKILSVDAKEVNFVYLKMENVKCGRHAIDKLVYADGRTEVMSAKIEVKSKDDWEKVMILMPNDDISGLKYQGFVGDIRKPVTPDMVGKDAEAIKKLKEDAASKGFPFVQVTAKKNIGYTYN